MTVVNGFHKVLYAQSPEELDLENCSVVAIFSTWDLTMSRKTFGTLPKLIFL